MIDIVLLVVGFSLGSFGYRIETMMEQGKTHARGKAILILLSLFSYFSLFILLILGIIVINWWITLLIFAIVGFIVGIAVHKITCLAGGKYGLLWELYYHFVPIMHAITILITIILSIKCIIYF